MTIKSSVKLSFDVKESFSFELRNKLFVSGIEFIAGDKIGETSIVSEIFLVSEVTERNVSGNLGIVPWGASQGLFSSIKLENISEDVRSTDFDALDKFCFNKFLSL